MAIAVGAFFYLFLIWQGEISGAHIAEKSIRNMLYLHGIHLTKESLYKRQGGTYG